MHYVVTGGLGFIGSAFVRLLLRERSDASVTVLDACTYAGNPANVDSVRSDARFRFVQGDIANAAAVDAAVGAGADAIVNFAAETHVDRSIQDPEAFLRTGVLGVHTLLEAVRRHSIKRFVHVSTDEVYGDVESGSSKETDPISPRSPYAAAKAAGDLLILAYRTTYGTPILITRGSNTYGPYQHPEKLVPLFTTNLLDGEQVPVYGDGQQIRDWLYVDDHARGILHVADVGVEGNVYNIAGGNSRTNEQIVRTLLLHTDRQWETSVRHVRDREGHDRRYSLDSAKLRSLGWKPQMPLEQGLAETVGWYRANEAWWRTIKSGEFRSYYQRQYASR